MIASAQLLAFLAAVAATPPPAGPEIVVANEVLLSGGDKVGPAMEAFVRRIESVGGWPAGSLRGKAFGRPRDALEYIRKNKVAFAFLPVHQLVQARSELKMDILGRAVGLDGTERAYWGVARNEPRSYEHVEEATGLRVATTEIDDVAWLRTLFEGNVREPGRQFKLMETPSGADAVAAVLAHKADVALISQLDFDPLKPKIERKVDLAWVYASGRMPAPPVVAMGKWARPADRQRMTTALEKICKKEGADHCGRMGIMYIQAGHAEDYKAIIKRYEDYR
jgi:ABC-type phosphate/phosphonate transport system substrate-binding protein